MLNLALRCKQKFEDGYFAYRVLFENGEKIAAITAIHAVEASVQIAQESRSLQQMQELIRQSGQALQATVSAANSKKRCQDPVWAPSNGVTTHVSFEDTPVSSVGIAGKLSSSRRQRGLLLQAHRGCGQHVHSDPADPSAQADPC